MNTNSDNNELENEERLIFETRFYQQLFDKMVIEGDVSHGYIWKLDGQGGAKQVFLSQNREQSLTPTEIGILAISLSLREGRDSQERLALGFFLQQFGIVSVDHIMQFAKNMIRRTRGEHAVKYEYVKNCTENPEKIILLCRAYESLQRERSLCRLKDSEDRIILGYVIALLGGTYGFRPYMVDNQLQTESWVDVYDHLFDNFSPESRQRYAKDGYLNLYQLFLQIRNDIAERKRLKKLGLNSESQAEIETLRVIQKVKSQI